MLDARDTGVYLIMLCTALVFPTCLPRLPDFGWNCLLFYTLGCMVGGFE
jgi:hypothetical protein